MNILHIEFDSVGSPLSGGGAIRNVALNSRLVRRGHSVIHLASRYPGAKARETFDGIEVVRIGRETFPWNFIWWFFNSGRRARAYEDWADLVVDDFTTPVGPTLCPLFLKRKPLVASVLFLNAWEMTKKYSIPFFLIERVLIRLYRNFTVLTPRQQILVLSKNPKARIRVFPCAVDQKYLALPEKKEESFVLFIGRMDIDMKGIDLLLAAFRIAVRQRPDIKLKMIGHGREEKRVLAMITDLQLSAHIDFVGPVPDVDKFDYILRSRFLVMPSRYEGFGIVALEAFACSKTVIVFEIENLNQVVTRERGIVVRRFNVDEYAANIISLWDDQEKRRELGSRGKKYVSELQWDNITAELETFYSQVINKWTMD
jgi:glycogen synthase